jgi:hypothetical protein
MRGLLLPISLPLLSPSPPLPSPCTEREGRGTGIGGLHVRSAPQEARELSAAATHLASLVPGSPSPRAAYDYSHVCYCR